MSARLEGRSAVIAGATRGLGLEIARAYVREGASICVCGRERDPLDRAVSELEGLAGAGQRVLGELCDVSSAADVQRLAERALAGLGEVTILVANAGVQGAAGSVEQADWGEWVRTVEVNLLGSVLLARAFVAHMRERGYGKIVQLSGGGATSPMPGLSAYAASKAAVVRFAETLAVELREHRVDVNALAPGALNTRMLEEVLRAGPERVGRAHYERALAQRDSGGVPLQRGAQLAVFLGSAASDGITGKLISAVWDPWRALPEHLAELDSDLYTLRRIVPADRGMDWGEV